MAKFDELYITGTGQKLYVHRKEGCKGYCTIHNPSNHHMKDWPTHWREDLGIFERICEHGVGHPDPDSLDYIRNYNPMKADTLAIHSCDGCCFKEDK